MVVVEGKHPIQKILKLRWQSRVQLAKVVDGSPVQGVAGWMAVQGVACQGGGWQSRGGQAWTAAWPQAAAALQWSGGSVSCLKTSTCQLLCLMTSTARVFKERNSSLVNLVKMMSGFTCDTASQCNGI